MTNQMIDVNSPPAEQPTLFLVDDETGILRAMARELKDLDVKIYPFEGAQAALDYLDVVKPDVVISDVRMPGMDGIEMMEVIATKLPLSERVLLSGYADMDAAIGAINKGRVHYYLEKPWDKEQLQQVVYKGIRLSQLRKENEFLEQLTQQQNAQLQLWNEELEKKVEARTHLLKESYQGSISTFSCMVEQRMHDHQSNSRQVADLCRSIGESLGLDKDDLLALNFAALMRNVGKIGFSDELLSTPYHAMTVAQRKEYQQHPNLSAVAMGALMPFKKSAPILASFCENVDGSGYPARLKGGDIPVTASILSIASDYYDLMAGYICDPALTNHQSRDWLVENREELYPADVVDASLAVLEKLDESIESIRGAELSVSCHALTEGMRLTRDLVSPAGVLLLSRGTQLDGQLISHLMQLERTGGLALQMFVINS